jgi:hypothetical protein
VHKRVEIMGVIGACELDNTHLYTSCFSIGFSDGRENGKIIKVIFGLCAFKHSL